MTPERWRKVDEIFQAALECPPVERKAFLDNCCAGDEELRREVESLISSDEEGLSLIDAPAFEVAAGLLVNTQPELSEGEEIGHYKIIRLLGAGGMGEVYLALDTELGRRIALKLLPAEFTRNKERLSRFQQEARIASALNHPNILTVYEIGQVDHRHYIATEFIDGQTLRQYLHGENLDPLDALEIAIQIGKALSAAHQAGIVHRDIKPENIMVRHDGYVKVLDFGLAKLTQRLSTTAGSVANRNSSEDTMPGLLMGTIRYMSPEQARGLTLDERSDIFSLGVVFYELLTGRPPFAGETNSDLLASLLKDEPPPVAEKLKGRAEEWADLFGKWLNKDKEKRYQTADELLGALGRFKAHLESESDEKIRVQAAMLSHSQDSNPILRTTAKRTNRTGRMMIQTESRGSAALPKGHLSRGILRHKGAVALVLAVLLLGAFALFVIPSKKPANPRISGAIRISNDGLLKQEKCCDRIHSSMVSDGARLIFAQEVSGRPPAVYQVSENGGETVQLPLGLENVHILGISPNRAELLVSTPVAPGESEAPLWSVPITGGAPRRLGDLLGHAATYSPDGKQIMYANGFDLFLASNEGGEARKLATLSGMAEWLRWSPDGKRLRFTIINPTSDSSPSLWEIRGDGSNLRPLLPGWSNPTAECCGNWTSDGRYYLFQSTHDKVSNIWALREEPDSTEDIKYEPQQLTFGPVDYYAPVPNSDGTKLFVVGEQRRGELVRFDFKTGNYEKYLSGISADCVDFSVDGQWVAYTTFPEGSLWRSRIDGSERLQLSFPPMKTFRPRWSPDGSKIVFSGLYPGQFWRSYLIPASGGNPEQVTSDDWRELDVGWTPDAKSLIFTKGPAREAFAIYLFDLTTHELALVPHSEGMFSSQMSPDGRYISAKTTDFKRFVVFDMKKNVWIELPEQSAGWQHWSSDSEYLFFVRIDKNYPQPGSLFRAHAGDWRIEHLADLRDINLASGAFGAWIGWTPDNSPLMLRDAGIQDVFALDLHLP